MARRLALIIGSADYLPQTGLSSLAAPVNDAQAIYELLAQYGGFDMLYTLPLANNQVGKSGQVQANELKRLLKEMLQPQADVELVLIYFSGHGVYEDGKGSFLSCYDDASAISLAWLAQLAKACSASVCLLLACCHSGAVLDFVEVRQKGLCIVAASSAQGEALAAGGNSVLTEQLCRALAPDEQHKLVTMRNLIQRLEQSRQNLPQQVLLQHSGTDIALTHWQANPDALTELPLWASQIGTDEYGRFAEVKLREQTQRLRWIEHAQLGFWMADTACTQALWLAVMGRNPAHFKGDLQRPVESVSWYGVQDFLTQLNQQVKGLNAALPTVAEWEAACCVQNGATKQHIKAQQPLTVQALAPNAHGLYQMLGNVWEWCNQLEADNDVKPLRGGCWASPKPLDCLSARGQSAAANRDYTIGFRWVVH